MKKKQEILHFEEERQKPRIPEEGRQRIHTSGAHKDKKRYDRKKEKKSQIPPPKAVA